MVAGVTASYVQARAAGETGVDEDDATTEDEDSAALDATVALLDTRTTVLELTGAVMLELDATVVLDVATVVLDVPATTDEDAASDTPVVLDVTATLLCLLRHALSSALGSSGLMEEQERRPNAQNAK